MTDPRDTLKRAAELLRTSYTTDVLNAVAVAAAMTAMPDDLLRELVRERGWVMVPAEPTQAMISAMRTGSRKDWPSDELCRVRYAALIAAAETPAKGADHE